MRRWPVALIALTGLVLCAPSSDVLAIDGVMFNSGTGHYYKRYSELVNWPTAKSRATSVGGYLAVVTSAAENSWLVANVTGTGGWIGATDEVSEGSFVWVTGEAFSYTNWNGGEPNNSGNEDYLEYGGNGWNDEPATDTQNGNGYIVEWDTDPNVTTPPEAPENLAAVAISDQRVDLAWDDVSDIETGVQVERSTEGGAFTRIATLDEDATDYVDLSVIGGTDFVYRVRATNTIGPSGYSNEAEVTTPPSAVAGLSAAALSNTRVRLTWQDNTDDETGFGLERGLGCPGAGFTLIHTAQADVTSYVDETALPETTYAYRLRALSDAGASEFTAEACVTMPPLDPSAASVEADGGTTVRLSWVDPSGTETGFEVERSETCPGVEWTLLATLEPDTTSYTDRTTRPEKLYAYRVRALSDDGASEWTPEVCLTTPPFGPTSAAAETLSATRFRIEWTDNTTIEQSYEVERALAGDGIYEPIANLPAGTTELLDRNANQETAYLYRVAAVGTNGRSDRAVISDAATPAVLLVRRVAIKRPKGKKPKPTKLTAAGEFDIGSTGVDLAGSAALGVGGGAVAIPAFAAKGKKLRFDGDGVRLDLAPSKTGSSRVTFKLTLTGPLAEAVEADGELTLTFRNEDFVAVGTVQLARDRFTPGKSGRLVDPAFHLTQVGARLQFGEKDTLKLKGEFDASGGIPETPPDVVVSIGFFEFTAPGGQFDVSGNKLVFKQTVLGSRTIILDYAKGRVSVSLKGIDLGQYEQGAAPALLGIDLGEIRFLDTPDLATVKSALKY